MGRIRAAITEERKRNVALLVELLDKIRREAADDLERAPGAPTIELSEIKATLAELRQVVAAERSKGRERGAWTPPLTRRELISHWASCASKVERPVSAVPPKADKERT